MENRMEIMAFGAACTVVLQGLTRLPLDHSSESVMLVEDLPNLVSKHIVESHLWPDSQHL